MSLQVAFGGGLQQYLDDDSGFTETLTLSDYYEPGFNIMFPLEFQVSSTIDTIYIVLQKRTNTLGTAFASITPAEFTTNVEDATTGSEISHTLAVNSVKASWDSIGTPLVLTISNVDSTSDPTCRVRSMNVSINEIAGDGALYFKVSLIDETQSFAYMTFKNKDNRSIEQVAKFGSRVALGVSPQGNYLLLTPSKKFAISTKLEGDFSYPKGSVYYNLEKGFNDESYDWSIGSVSDSDLSDVVSVRPISDKPSVGVVNIESFASNVDPDVDGLIYFDVKALGRSSGAEDIFRVYLKKNQTVSIDLL